MSRDHVGNILFFANKSLESFSGRGPPVIVICEHLHVLLYYMLYVFRGKQNTETGFHHSYQVAKYLVLSGLCIPRG